jgi:fucose permease
MALTTPGSSAPSEKIERSQQVRMQLALAFLAFILIGGNEGALGVLIPSIEAHYVINRTTLSLIFLAGTIGYLSAAASTGSLMHRLGTRNFLLLGFGSLAGSMCVLALMPPFWGALLAYLPLGFGVAVIDSGLNTVVAALPRNVSLLNYLHASYGGGALLGPLLASGMLTVGLSWNIVYVTLATCALLIAVGIFWGYRTASKAAATVGTAANGGETKGAARGSLPAALRMRAVLFAALFLAVYGGTEVSAGSWSYSFLTLQRHVIPLYAGWMVSAYWMGLTGGRLFLARVIARLGERRAIQLGIAGVVVALVMLWFSSSAVVSAVALCFIGFCLGPMFPTTIAVTSQFVPGPLLPSAIGFLMSVSSAGAALFPWAAGAAMQEFSLSVLPPYLLVLTFAMAIGWVALWRSTPAQG